MRGVNIHIYACCGLHEGVINRGICVKYRHLFIISITRPCMITDRAIKSGCACILYDRSRGIKYTSVNKWNSLINIV